MTSDWLWRRKRLAASAIRTRYSPEKQFSSATVDVAKSNWPKNCFFRGFGQVAAANLVNIAVSASETEVIAEIETADIRIVDDVVRPAVGQHFAGMDDIGPVDQAKRLAHIVVGDENTDTA